MYQRERERGGKEQVPQARERGLPMVMVAGCSEREGRFGEQPEGEDQEHCTAVLSCLWLAMIPIEYTTHML